MCTAGLVGPLMSFETMVNVDGFAWQIALIEILVMHFVLPAIISLGVSEAMRKLNLIKNGDMRLDV